MAGQSSRGVDEIITALSPLVSTRSHRPALAKRGATPVRKGDGTLLEASSKLRTVERERDNLTQSVSPIKEVVVRRPSPMNSRLSNHSVDSHPFTNSKIRMLLDSQSSALPDKASLKLPRLGDLPKKSL